MGFRTFASVATAALLLGGPGTVQAQPVRRDFEGNAPAIGSPMRDAVVHDRDGKALRLKEVLRDCHTVLILGCLT